MAGIFEFLFGSGDKLQKVETMTGEQKGALSSLLSQLSGMAAPTGAYGMAQSRLQELLSGTPEAYQQFTAPYMRQFQEQTIPQLAERFAGAGALSSSGFGQALGAAGAGLQENLASMRAGNQLGAIQSALGQYLNTAQLGLGAQPFGYQRKVGSPGFLPQFASFGLTGIGQGGYGSLAKLFGLGGF